MVYSAVIGTWVQLLLSPESYANCMLPFMLYFFLSHPLKHTLSPSCHPHRPRRQRRGGERVGFSSTRSQFQPLASHVPEGCSALSIMDTFFFPHYWLLF